MAHTPTRVDRVFRALGDPTRRAIVERLASKATTVSALATLLSITVTAVGQHLQVLEKSGLAITEKIGRVRTCRIDPSGFAALDSWLSLQRTTWERRLDRLGDVLDE